MSAERDATIIADYLAGIPWADLAARHGSKSTIQRALLAAGVVTNRRPHAPHRRAVDVFEDAEFLADDGAGLADVLTRLDVKKDAFWQACKRHGRRDLYRRLAEREPNVQRHATRRSA